MKTIVKQVVELPTAALVAFLAQAAAENREIEPRGLGIHHLCGKALAADGAHYASAMGEEVVDGELIPVVKLVKLLGVNEGRNDQVTTLIPLRSTTRFTLELETVVDGDESGQLPLEAMLGGGAAPVEDEDEDDEPINMREMLELFEGWRVTGFDAESPMSSVEQFEEYLAKETAGEESEEGEEGSGDADEAKPEEVGGEPDASV